MQNGIETSLFTGHGVYDTVVGLVVLAMSATKVVEWLRIWGFLPESQRRQRNGNGLDSTKYVGALTVDVLEQKMRHLVRNEITLAIPHITKPIDDQTELLNKINAGIIEMVTLLRLSVAAQVGKA